MRHTVKRCLVLGTVVAGVVILFMKIFQPITFFHLTIFSYSIIISAVLAGVVTHKRVIIKSDAVEDSEEERADYFMHKRKLATLHTKDGKKFRGRFLKLDDSHIVMDYLWEQGGDSKSMLVLEKNMIKRLEVD